MELLTNGARMLLGRVLRVVADHEVVGLVHVAQELLALHLGDAAGGAQLDNAAVKLVTCGHKHLEQVEDVRDVTEGDKVVELKAREVLEAPVKL